MWKNRRKKGKVKVLVGTSQKEGTLERSAMKRGVSLGFGVRVSCDQDLLEEITRIWSRSVAELPVHKDLPRLAGRTTVDIKTREFKDLEIEEERVTARKSTLDRWKQQQGGMQQTDSEEVQEEIYFDSNATWYVSCTADPLPPLPARKRAAQWPPISVRGLLSVVFTAGKSCAIYVYDQDTETMIAEGINVRHLHSVEDSSRYFYLDLPDGDDTGIAFYTREDSVAFLDALDRFNEMTKKPGSAISYCLEEEPEIRDMTLKTRGRLKSFVAIRKLVLPIVKHMEDPETLRRAETLFSKFESCNRVIQTESSDFTNLLMDCLGDCATSRILKCINQNFIFSAAFEIKTKVTKTTMTKDVRDENGWKVFVTLAPNAIIIVHKKREMSFGGEPDSDFWFEWELSLIFDSTVSKLEAVQLQITNLQFDENCSETNKEKWNSVFCNGNLRVY